MLMELSIVPFPVSLKPLVSMATLPQSSFSTMQLDSPNTNNLVQYVASL